MLMFFSIFGGAVRKGIKRVGVRAMACFRFDVIVVVVGKFIGDFLSFEFEKISCRIKSICRYVLAESS